MSYTVNGHRIQAVNLDVLSKKDLNGKQHPIFKDSLDIKLELKDKRNQIVTLPKLTIYGNDHQVLLFNMNVKVWCENILSLFVVRLFVVNIFIKTRSRQSFKSYEC